MQPNKIVFSICLGLAVLLVSSAALAQYQVTNLFSNQIGAAKHIDPLQVNGWGLAASAKGPFWSAIKARAGRLSTRARESKRVWRY